jgi:hypothetical protein
MNEEKSGPSESLGVLTVGAHSSPETDEERREREAVEAWLEGVAGRRHAQFGSPFEPIDAKIAALIRKDIAADESQVSDISVACVSTRIGELTKPLRSGWRLPLLAGATVSLIGLAVALLLSEPSARMLLPTNMAVATSDRSTSASASDPTPLDELDQDEGWGRESWSRHEPPDLEWSVKSQDPAVSASQLAADLARADIPFTFRSGGRIQIIIPNSASLTGTLAHVLKSIDRDMYGVAPGTSLTVQFQR